MVSLKEFLERAFLYKKSADAKLPSMQIVNPYHAEL